MAGAGRRAKKGTLSPDNIMSRQRWASAQLSAVDNEHFYEQVDIILSSHHKASTSVISACVALRSRYFRVLLSLYTQLEASFFVSLYLPAYYPPRTIHNVYIEKEKKGLCLFFGNESNRKETREPWLRIDPPEDERRDAWWPNVSIKSNSAAAGILKIKRNNNNKRNLS